MAAHLLLFWTSQEGDPVDPPEERPVPVVSFFETAIVEGVLDPGPLEFYFCDIEAEQESFIEVELFPNTIDIVMDSAISVMLSFIKSPEFSVAVNSRPSAQLSFDHCGCFSIACDVVSDTRMYVVYSKTPTSFDINTIVFAHAMMVVAEDKGFAPPLRDDTDISLKYIDFIL